LTKKNLTDGCLVKHVTSDFFLGHDLFAPMPFVMNSLMELLFGQRRNEGIKGGTIPRAPNHCGGRRKVPTTSQVLSSIQYICFRKTSGWNMGRQTCFLPRAPSSLVTPLCLLA